MDETLRRPLLGVSVCVLDGDRALLVERGRGAFAGRLSLPGGKVEFGESLAEAARRELVEETGLNTDDVAFLQIHEAIGDGVHAVIAVHAASLPGAAARARAADDAASLAWLTLPEIERAEAEGRTTAGLAAVVRDAIAASARS